MIVTVVCGISSKLGMTEKKKTFSIYFTYSLCGRYKIYCKFKELIR